MSQRSGELPRRSGPRLSSQRLSASPTGGGGIGRCGSARTQCGEGGGYESCDNSTNPHTIILPGGAFFQWKRATAAFLQILWPILCSMVTRTGKLRGCSGIFPKFASVRFCSPLMFTYVRLFSLINAYSRLSGKKVNFSFSGQFRVIPSNVNDL